MSNPNDPYQPQDPQQPNPYGSPSPYGTPAPGQGGAGGAYPAYGGAYGGDGNPKKGIDGVSITGFVLSLTCCLSFVGAILGFIGLKRTKQPGGHSGRWAAVSAIVVGIVGTLALAGFVVVAVVFGGESVDDLKTGQCITGSGLNMETDEGVSSIKVVECDTSHDAEVLGTKRLSSDEADDYDIDDTSMLSELCLDVVDVESLGDVDPSDITLIGLTQSESPDSGDKLACIAIRTDGGELKEKIG